MLRMWLPMVPPSTDNAYMPVVKHVAGRPRAIIILAPDGRKFKTEATAHLAKHFPTQLKEMRPNLPYMLFAKYHMKTVENVSYPNSAKNRYKGFDTTNRIKLLEDVIADVSAVDDSHYIIGAGMKVKSATGKEYTEMWIWSLEEEGCPFYAAALAL